MNLLSRVWVRFRATWAWQHRTKVLGTAAVGVAYVQNHLAQLGHVIPSAWTGAILAGFGVAAFAIGLFNTLIGDPPPSTE